MPVIISITLGGGIGAVARYSVSQLVDVLFGSSFPVATIIVNILGAFLIGFFFQWFEDRVIPETIRSFVTIGFLGAFTTFSSFTLETLKLLQESNITAGMVNIFINNFFSLFAVLAGFFCWKLLFKKSITAKRS
ncbi:MAG: fluoride efflux transporter CrcB [Spirochaetales bacterium]|nr:fluoride efflux transporter CrcB [Spirochaetales bacterium]